MLFEKLNSGNQERAIAEIKDNDGYFEYEDSVEHIKTDFKTILELFGYYNINCYYSGFSSQGDGASFTASYYHEPRLLQKIKSYAPQDEELHRLAKELTNTQRKVRYDLGAKLTTSGANYSHEMTMRVETHSNNSLVDEDIIAEKCEDEILEHSRDLARWYYKKLNEAYDYSMLDETVKAYIIANEIDFDYEDNDDEIPHT